MGKSRDLVNIIGDIKGTFHAKMGTIKGRIGMDLTEEDIKKRWQECREELYKNLDDRGFVVEPEVRPFPFCCLPLFLWIDH